MLACVPEWRQHIYVGMSVAERCQPITRIKGSEKCEDNRYTAGHRLCIKRLNIFCRLPFKVLTSLTLPSV